MPLPPMRPVLVPALLLALCSAAGAAPATRQAAPPPERAASMAIEVLPRDWRVMHCGVSRGVLWVTYVHEGRAAITPAVPNDVIHRACAAAGHPSAASMPQRAGIAPPATSIYPAPPAVAGAPPPARGMDRRHPVITASTAGGLGVEARNASDIPWHCTVHFSWMGPEPGAGLRSGSAQATVLPGQSARIVAAPEAGPNARFMGAPSAVCTPAS
jgi:hypothetical protein